MKHSKREPNRFDAMIWIWPVLITVPLIIGLSWGIHFKEEVYTLLRYASNLASGLGLTYGSIAESPSPPLSAPLLAAILSLPARTGINLIPAAAIISLLGWSTIAFAFLAIGSTWRRPYGALISALLLIFNPWIITTLGGPTSWVIALIWLSVALFIRQRYVLTAIMVFLLAIMLIQWPSGNLWSHLSNYSGPITWSILLLSAGMGAEWLAEYLTKREVVNLTYKQTSTSLLVATLVLLGSLQAVRLWQLYQERPLARWQLENSVALWLQSETPPSAKLLASEKIGYIAQRQTVSPLQLQIMGESISLNSKLQNILPDYIVTDLRLPWQNETSSAWFQLGYQPLKQFPAPYVPGAPYTVWAYRPPLDYLEPRQVVNARVPDRLRILGYQTGPGEAQPGESVQMALYLQAPEAAAGPENSFSAIVRLISPVDGSTQADWQVTLPQSVQPGQWQPEEVITEEFSLPLPQELEPGAFKFNMSLLGSESPELWPISFDNDINRLDRIPIGSVIIPWRGDLKQMQPREVNFEDQIRLVGYTISDAQNGLNLDVSLFWQTDQLLDKDYTVFVHILDETGSLVAGHDSQPANGRFPTTTWRDGMTIQDTHIIDIPGALADGEYQIMVGLYLPETGGRLRIVDNAGTISLADTLLLERLSLP